MDQLLEATRRAERDHFWFRGFRRFVRPLVAEAAAGLARPRILDCGCGTGANLALLAEFGEPFGIDLTGSGLQYARARGCSRVARATIAAMPFPDRSFDIVTSFDVLQCVPEPAEAHAVGEMYRVLRPDGTAIVNVAAMDVLRGNHSVLSEEVRRYSPRRLRGLLEDAGFEVRRLTFANATLFPLMLGVRTFQRMVGLKPAEEARFEITVPPAPINAALSATLALEARALRHVDMPFGSSLFCVARKRQG